MREKTLVDFSDPHLVAVLFILLKDRTTGRNIIWATDPPPELGVGFGDEITVEQIRACPPVPRVLKRLDEQKQRTRHGYPLQGAGLGNRQRIFLPGGFRKWLT